MYLVFVFCNGSQVGLHLGDLVGDNVRPLDGRQVILNGVNGELRGLGRTGLRWSVLADSYFEGKCSYYDS